LVAFTWTKGQGFFRENFSFLRRTHPIRWSGPECLRAVLSQNVGFKQSIFSGLFSSNSEAFFLTVHTQSVAFTSNPSFWVVISVDVYPHHPFASFPSSVRFRPSSLFFAYFMIAGIPPIFVPPSVPLVPGSLNMCLRQSPRTCSSGILPSRSWGVLYPFDCSASLKSNVHPSVIAGFETSFHLVFSCHRVQSRFANFELCLPCFSQSPSLTFELTGLLHSARFFSLCFQQDLFSQSSPPEPGWTSLTNLADVVLPHPTSLSSSSFHPPVCFGGWFLKLLPMLRLG